MSATPSEPAGRGPRASTAAGRPAPRRGPQREGGGAPLLHVPTLRYNERRDAPRAPLQLRVDCCPLVPTTHGMVAVTVRRCVATDLSVTGLFVRDASPVKVGTAARLVFRLPDDLARPVICYARVVRAVTDRAAGYGLAFQHLNEADAGRIERLVLLRLARRSRLGCGASR